jgi:hypothetical protein
MKSRASRNHVLRFAVLLGIVSANGMISGCDQSGMAPAPRITLSRDEVAKQEQNAGGKLDSAPGVAKGAKKGPH